MQRFFIRHKLSEGDIVHLSDTDSAFIINDDKLHEEDIIEVATLSELFSAQITFIDTASVEVEILKKLAELQADVQESENGGITIVQAVSNDPKFVFFVEKAVEIGVSNIIPVHSELCLIDIKEGAKKSGLWQKVIDDATEQSRNPQPPLLFETVELNEIGNLMKSHSLMKKNTRLLCLATENIEVKKLGEALTNTTPDTNYIVAIGPEKGWSKSDLDVFKKLGFEFVSLGKNILRTETAGLVVASIIKYNAELL